MVGTNPFICEHNNPVRPGEPFTLDQCHLCRSRLGVGVGLPPPPPPADPCRFEGDEVGGAERERLGLPHGRVWLECLSESQPLGRYVCKCQGCGPRCGGYRAEGAFDPDLGRRHLLYHVLPVRGNGVWRRGVEQLAARWPLFTGRAVVAVATGAGLDDPAEVRRCLPAGAEVIAVPNDPERREVATWLPLWDAVADHIGEYDSVLYAHAKGVTRNVDPGNSCQWWASLLYSLNLDHWPRVATGLRGLPVVGSLKKVGKGFGGCNSAWHYTGSFFWMRGRDALARVRRHPVPGAWWGVEAWPGVAYTPAEGGVVWKIGTVPDLDMYDPRKWAEQYRREYAEWVGRNPPQFPWVSA